MSIKTTKEKELGIGLVETVVALGVTVIVLTALVSLAVSTLRTSNKSKLLLRASKFANSELELVRACRDAHNTWSEFMTSIVTTNDCANGCYMVVTGINGDKCAIGSALGIASNANGKVYDQGGPLELWVGFFVTNPNGPAVTDTDNIIRVNAWTSWTASGVENKNYIYSDLTNWRGN